jgi:hypothetical protein
MKKLLTLLLAIMLIILTSCGKSNNSFTPSNTDEPSTTITTPSDDNPTNTTEEEDETANMKLILKIDGIEVDVNWLDNNSVKTLKELSKDGLTINMSMYGDFEQVGSLGKSITSSDERITTSPGDIVLYSSNQIVIFYGSNTWSYTKLGHISLTKSELTDLLVDKDVTIALTLK